MTDLDWSNVVPLAIRATNAVLWLAILVRFWDRPAVTNLGRRMILTVLAAGMVALVLGGLVPFGFPGDAARFVYTAFTGYAAIVALAILTGP